jgi:hypothetical protein
MREIIEHVKVVTLNGENINFQDVFQAGFQVSCYTKDTVLRAGNSEIICIYFKELWFSKPQTIASFVHKKTPPDHCCGLPG